MSAIHTPVYSNTWNQVVIICLAEPEKVFEMLPGAL
jgi:hypothetical protein